MTRALLTVLNECNPNKIPDAMRALPVGTALSLVARTVRLVVDPADDTGALPEEAKAAALLAVRVTAGTVTGPYTILQSDDQTPASGSVGLTPSGDVIFAAADNVTDAEVTYFVAEGYVREETLAVTAQVADFAAGVQGRLLLSAYDETNEAALDVAIRDGNPGAGAAAITLDGTGIDCGDASTDSVTVRYIAFPPSGTSVDEKLLSDVTF